MAANEAMIATLALYLTIAVGIIMLGATIVGSIAFWRAAKGQAKTFSMMFQRANVLQVLTAILVVLVACLLRMLNEITAEAVVGILSGVAGYVLGGSFKPSLPAEPADD